MKSAPQPLQFLAVSALYGPFNLRICRRQASQRVDPREHPCKATAGLNGFFRFPEKVCMRAICGRGGRARTGITAEALCLLLHSALRSECGVRTPCNRFTAR
jgi:hypothetical protein